VRGGGDGEVDMGDFDDYDLGDNLVDISDEKVKVKLPSVRFVFGFRF
jgi:hypothetical protein